MKKECKATILGVSFIVSFVIQTYTIFSYLEDMAIWPPQPSITGIVFLLTLAFSIFSLIMVARAEKEQKFYSAVFWVICVVLFFPWVYNSLNQVINNLSGG